MKSFITFFILTLLNINSIEQKRFEEIQKISIQEAELILGQQASLKEQNSGIKNEVNFFKSTFVANKIDAQTNKLGNLYYAYEVYKNAEEANKLIQSFIQSNQNHHGFERLKDFGDEAFIITDQTNFITFISTKANKMIRLKVNKVTSKTSMLALKRIANKLMNKL